MFVVSKPDVFKSPTADTYIIFGEAKIEDLAAKQAALNQEQIRQQQQQQRAESKFNANKAPTPSNDTATATAAAPGSEEQVDRHTYIQLSRSRVASIVLTLAVTLGRFHLQ